MLGWYSSAATSRTTRTSSKPPLGEHDDPLWIARQVAYVAGAMRGGRFRAIENSYCGKCDLKTSCPLMDEGRPVTR